jgi:ADP-heptose:LPS heptosyltransferase
LDAIGDALTLVPAIAALRRHGWRVGAVLGPANAQIFSHRALDRVHVAGTQSESELIAGSRAQQYGAAIIPTEKPEGYRLPYRARIPVRVGFENGWGKPLKTLWVRRLCTRTLFRTAGLDPRAPHECEVVFALARAIDGDPDPPRDPQVLRPYVLDDEPSSDERIAFQVTDKWQRLGASLDEVAELARRVRAVHVTRFISAQHEGSYAAAFGRATGFSVESFADLPSWKTAIGASRTVVAPDSGASHVAGMTGTPVVSCFAHARFALQSARWAPWAAPHRIVRIEPNWPLAACDALEELLSGSPRFSYKG